MQYMQFNHKVIQTDKNAFFFKNKNAELVLWDDGINSSPVRIIMFLIKVVTEDEDTAGDLTLTVMLFEENL